MRVAALSLVGGFGFALLALAVFHTTTVGNCGSNAGRYAQAQPCPSNTVWWFGALAAGIVLLATVGSLVRAGTSVGGAVFLAVGGACVASLATGSENTSWLIAAIVLAALFLPIGVIMLRAQPPPRSARLAAVGLPLAAVGVAAAVAAGLAIPGPLREPKIATAKDNVAPLAADSWFTAASFRRGLGEVRTQLGSSARVESIDLTPARAVIDALRGDTLHGMSLGVGVPPEDYSSPASGDEHTTSFAAIDTQAPQRLLRAIRTRFHVDATAVAHIDFALGVVDGAPAWEAYVKDSTRSYRADAHGRNIRPCRDGVCTVS